MPENHEHLDGDQRARLQREQSQARLESLAERIAEERADRKVRETFRLLGHDITDQDGINDLRRDLDYARRAREAAEGRSKSIVTTVLTTMVGAIVTAIIAAVSGIIRIGGNH